MPLSFLAHQMAWREALDDAGDEAAVQALADEVAQHEAAGLQRLQRLLDEQGNAAEAAAQVRALMFVARFRQDIDNRLEALQP